MSIDRMGNELAALGVSGRDVRCLLLLPQIYVGWMLERRDLPALEVLLDTTVRRGQLGAGAFTLARGWLFERPSRAQFQSAFALLRALRRAPERSSIASSDLLEAMLWACRAAQLERRRGARSGDAALSPAVARALSQLEAWLEIDGANLWEDVLAADSDEASAAASRAAARFDGLSDAELERATAPLTAPAADDEPSLVRLRHDSGAARDERAGQRDENSAPASAPFPLLRRLA
jgi:hypothetical protein